MEVSSRRAYQARLRAADPTATKPPSRAGRDLPAAIAVGVGLGALIVGTLLWWKPSFLILVTVVVVIASLELVTALQSGRISAPVVPVLVGALSLSPVAYLWGSAALATAYVLTCVLILLWRAAAGTQGAARDIAGGIFITSYVALLAALTSLILAEPDGAARMIVFLLVATMSDIGGYAVGVLFGRRPMVPSVSPKKSWEGFAGSVLTCVVAASLAVPLLLGGPWWAGILLGVPVAFFATVGDLAESTLKRDLGIKDMGNLLPGHGGVMDRLDSLLVTAPVAWILLGLLVPA